MSSKKNKDGLLNWDLLKLIELKIIKNIKKISYDDIKSKLSVQKCSCADGVFDEKDTKIWACKKCDGPYHENCAKLVSILEGNCRICNVSFLEKKFKLGES